MKLIILLLSAFMALVVASPIAQVDTNTTTVPDIPSPILSFNATALDNGTAIGIGIAPGPLVPPKPATPGEQCDDYFSKCMKVRAIRR